MALINRLREKIYKGRPWYERPRLSAVNTLIQIRKDLREQNLHDTEDVPCPADSLPYLRMPRSGWPHDGRDLQRSQVPPNGCGGHALRTQLPTEGNTPRRRYPDDSESARDQQNSDDACAVPACHHPQPAGRGMDSV